MKERDIMTFSAGFSTAIVLGIIGLAFLLSLAGCAVSRPAPVVTLPVVNQAQVQHLDSLALQGWLPTNLSTLPAYLVPAPAGSTPRQRRQWQKAQTQNLAHAGVLPAKVKNSNLATAPGATAINRPASTVATGAGSTATDARKAGTRHGAVAVGAGAVATSTSAGTSWWWFVLAAIVGAVGWEVLTSQLTPLRLLLKWRKVA